MGYVLTSIIVRESRFCDIRRVAKSILLCFLWFSQQLFGITLYFKVKFYRHI